jgi:hypothetical protein
VTNRMWAMGLGALRCCIGAMVLAGVMAKQVSAQDARSIRVTPQNVRFTNYLNDLTGPSALIGVVGGGLLHQDELPDGLASKLGQHAVQVSVTHGLAAVMHRSTGYQPCGCRGFGPRVAHALLQTLTVPRMAGAYAGSFARMAWEPDRSVGDAAAGATLSLGFSALFHIARELTGVGR